MKCFGQQSGIAIVLSSVLASSLVEAVRQPSHLAGRPELEVAAGLAPVRAHRDVTWNRAPQGARAAWDRFTAANGFNWYVYFDAATGVPGRLFGEGIAAPGSVASPAVAEQAARAFLANHLDLLAPGASPSDFVLAGNVESRGLRAVGFFQTWNGMRVLGGQVSFRFKYDRLFVIGSEALPDVAARLAPRPLGAAAAREAARAWLLRDMQDATGTAVAGVVDGPFVLPLVPGAPAPGAAAIAYRTVLRVVVDTTGPRGRWEVYVDARTGAEVARKQTLHFASGTLNLNAPVRYPESTRMDYPAQHLNVTADGASATADGAGAVTWSGAAAATINTTATGTYVQVLNDSGGEIAASFNVLPGGTATWDVGTVEFDDAQLATYLHNDIAKDRCRVMSPEMNWLDSSSLATVNINDTCNAFSDGDTINMFRAGGGCGNTGRLADVVYHEFGHSYHAHAIIPGVGDWGDGSLGEGIGDYLAATITGDSGMGRGFFLNSSPLREIDPPGDEPHWPEDVSEIHETGIIFAGTMFDFRKAMIAAMGEAMGVAYSDRMYFEIIQRAVDIPSTYVEALASDDDDGNLMNGTPHGCTINDVWGAHGLAMAGGPVGVSVGTPVLTGLHVEVPVLGMLSAMCPDKDIDHVDLNWNLRDNETVAGTVQMTNGTTVYTADLPMQQPGRVLNYQVVATMKDGTVITYPDNPADRKYEVFLGDVEVIYCTDFEGAEPAGWTHALDMGMAGEGADDWHWGEPRGMGGDPGMAYSGTSVFGNDLGGGNFNGQYQPDKVNHLASPEIDASAFPNVRLQYRRWLNVEDGVFDRATIYANDMSAWNNQDSGNPMGGTNHLDKEWRFQDVDLTPFLAAGKVTLKWEIRSDPGAEFGGWTLDDVCVVGYSGPLCGNGVVELGEDCDDGAANSNTTADACRLSCTAPACGDTVVDTGEQCDDGNLENGDGCTSACTTGNTPPTPDAGTGQDGDAAGCGCVVGGARDAHDGPTAGLLALTALLGFGGLGLTLVRARRKRRR